MTQSRDTQELPTEVGAEMMAVMARFANKTSLLQDWAYYEMQASQAGMLKRSEILLQQQQQQPQQSQAQQQGNGVAGGQVPGLLPPYMMQNAGVRGGHYSQQHHFQQQQQQQQHIQHAPAHLQQMFTPPMQQHAAFPHGPHQMNFGQQQYAFQQQQLPQHFHPGQQTQHYR